MRFLIINNYPKNSIEKYEKLFQEIKKEILTYKTLLLGIQIIKISRIQELSEYIFLLTQQSQTNNANKERSKNFDLLDIVIIIGNSSSLPFLKKQKNLLDFIKMCILVKKPILCTGSAVLHFLSLVSLNLENFNIINNPLKESIEESLCKYKPVNDREVILDLRTGDIFTYQPKKVLNIVNEENKPNKNKGEFVELVRDEVQQRKKRFQNKIKRVNNFFDFQPEQNNQNNDQEREKIGEKIKTLIRKNSRNVQSRQLNFDDDNNKKQILLKHYKGSEVKNDLLDNKIRNLNDHKNSDESNYEFASRFKISKYKKSFDLHSQPIALNCRKSSSKQNAGSGIYIEEEIGKSFNKRNSDKQRILSRFLGIESRGKCLSPRTKWEPKFNIGFYHQEKAQNPSFHLHHLFIAPKERQKKDKTWYCRIHPNHLNHFLFEHFDNNVEVRRLNSFKIVEIQKLNPKFDFSILAEFLGNPLIFQLDNLFCLYFLIEKSNRNLWQLFLNFLNFYIKKIKNEDLKIAKLSIFNAKLENRYIPFKSDFNSLNPLNNFHNPKTFVVKHSGMCIRKKNLQEYYDTNSIQNHQSLKFLIYKKQSFKILGGKSKDLSKIKLEENKQKNARNVFTMEKNMNNRLAVNKSRF